MQLLIIIQFFLFTQLQSSIYDLQIQTVDGKTISMSTYKGQKIVIQTISPESMQAGGLDFLDSLQKAHPAIPVIAVPALDFGGERNTEVLSELINKKSTSVIITALVQVKKTADQQQDRLLYWLTHASDNIHYDTDVETDEQLFIISESGILYGVIEKGASPDVLDKVLNQEDVTE